MPRCKKGTRRNKKTGNCEAVSKKTTKVTGKQMFNVILDKEKLKKGITLEDLAVNLPGKILVVNAREAEDDGLWGNIQLLDNDNPLKTLDSKLKSRDFSYTALNVRENCIQISFAKGYRDAEESWKFFNVPRAEFNKLNHNFDEEDE